MQTERRRYKDRADYLKLAIAKRRKVLKIRAVKVKGGKCELCGYNKYFGALEFHHINPSKKRFNLSVDELSRRPWEMVKIELKKCVLVCSNCHREIHGKVTRL